MKTQHLLAIGCACATACAQPDPGTGETVQSIEYHPTSVCQSTTITGKVFYNDLRSNGRFGLRTYDGGVTTGHGDAYGNTDNINYLGLLDATVKIYELDTSYPRNPDLENPGGDPDCKDEDLEGTAIVQRDGTFTWTGTVCDACGIDPDGDVFGSQLTVGAKVFLENCADPNTRCFSVDDPQGDGVNDHFDDDWWGETWSQWLDGASWDSPLVFTVMPVGGSSSFDVGRTDFQSPNDPLSEPARAANVFASMVDVTRKVHMLLNLPFDRDKVTAYFPAATDTDGGGHSHPSGERLCVSDAWPAGWVSGAVAPHEYGHLIHYWRWDSNGKWVSYSFDSDHDGHLDQASDLDDDGDNDVDRDYNSQPWLDGTPDYLNEPDESDGQEEWENAAFKEGWAEFISGVTFNGTGSPDACDTKTSQPTQGSISGVSDTGNRYIQDVAKVLCDLWDPDVDCDTRDGSQVCDNTNLTLNTMADRLEDVWTNTQEPYKSMVEATTSSPSTWIGTTLFGLCSLHDEMNNASLDETFAVSGVECP